MFRRLFRGHHHGDGRRFHRDGHRFGHRSRGARGGRFLETGDLRLVILRLVADKPRHGYELMKEIEERAGGAYSPSPGVVYPTLTYLEEAGHLAVAGTEGARKLYAITPEGEAALAASRAEADAVLARLGHRGEESSGRPSVFEAARAAHGLKSALRHRLSGGALSDEQARTIVAILEEATARVERA